MIWSRWSFGGNRLQIKAEDKILDDVTHALGLLSDVPHHGRRHFKSLQSKQDLLQLLIDNERLRLRVWLYPLEGDRKHFVPQTSGNKSSTEVRRILRLYQLLVVCFSIIFRPSSNSHLGCHIFSAASLG